MMSKPRLMTPGPAPVPQDVLLELAQPVFHHRTDQSPDHRMHEAVCCDGKDHLVMSELPFSFKYLADVFRLPFPRPAERLEVVHSSQQLRAVHQQFILPCVLGIPAVAPLQRTFPSQ